MGLEALGSKLYELTHPSEKKADEKEKKQPSETQRPPQKDLLSEEAINDVAKTRGYLRTLSKGGSVSSASKRADGIAQRGKTRGTYIK